jgi:hypothetical protein
LVGAPPEIRFVLEKLSKLKDFRNFQCLLLHILFPQIKLAFDTLNRGAYGNPTSGTY